MNTKPNNENLKPLGNHIIFVLDSHSVHILFNTWRHIFKIKKKWYSIYIYDLCKMRKDRTKIYMSTAFAINCSNLININGRNQHNSSINIAFKLLYMILDSTWYYAWFRIPFYTKQQFETKQSKRRYSNSWTMRPVL